MKIIKLLTFIIVIAYCAKLFLKDSDVTPPATVGTPIAGLLPDSMAEPPAGVESDGQGAGNPASIKPLSRIESMQETMQKAAEIQEQLQKGMEEREQAIQNL